MNRFGFLIQPHRSRRLCVLGASALLALGVAGSAQAGGVSSVAAPGVSFPSPGTMAFARLPAQVAGGHHFTLHAELPLAIFGGVMHLQRQTPSGHWRSLVSAAVRPRIFWLHWFVPARWRGSQLSVRFVLKSGGLMLASSPTYTIAVSA
ncbi:MAG TPA: hypothetical protein VGG41_11780 [Solirubrobacteraceae bacterium]|jgi:hypothetical protein